MAIKRRGSQARRQPHRRVPLDSELAGLPFEELVARALDGLPADIRRLLDNVAVVIEDDPTPHQLRASGLGPEETLYGLYEGTPGVVYGADWSAMPNKISLFRMPLQEDFTNPSELAEQVRRTVVHELAHHAGIDDDRLHRFGLY